MLSDLAVFTVLFTQLDKEVRGSPTSLSWLVESKSRVKKLALLVGEKARVIRRAQALGPDPFSVVPPGFIPAWSKFEAEYFETIEKILRLEGEATVAQLTELLEEVAAKKEMTPEALLDELSRDFVNHQAPGDSFDPFSDDPASLLFEMISGDSSLADDSGYLSDKAFGAWRFFDETLHVKHRDIHLRFKTVPHLLIPEHAVRANPRPIFELYNEAARCYVFGNNIAAVCTCRALMEHVLKHHYRLDGELDVIVSLAEARYPATRDLGLHSKRKLANRVMHDYEKQARIDDSLVVGFLKTIQSLIQGIPS